MPHPKSVLSYPIQYFELLKRAVIEDVHIPFPAESKARTFQMRLGGFRAALQRGPEIDTELALASYGISIARRGNVVIVGPKRCEEAVLKALQS